jgi:hypothetical protein
MSICDIEMLPEDSMIPALPSHARDVSKKPRYVIESQSGHDLMERRPGMATCSSSSLTRAVGAKTKGCCNLDSPILLIGQLSLGALSFLHSEKRQ